MIQFLLLVVIAIIFGAVAGGIVWHSWTILDKVLPPAAETDPEEPSPRRPRDGEKTRGK